MTDLLLASMVCTALMRVGSRMATGFDQHFNALGLTQSQFRILLTLYEKGQGAGLAPSVLADYLLIERGTVSVLTQRMVQKGLLARAPGSNRRTFQLMLTPRGSDLLEQAIPRAVALADHTLAGIAPDQLAQMASNLEAIENHLRAFTPLEINNGE